MQDFKTEIKVFLIVTVVAIIFTGGAILLLKAIQPAPVAQAPQSTPILSPQPQTVDTSGWQTYHNEELGFEVKFPSDLVLQKNTGETYVSFSGKLVEESYFLQFGYIAQSTLYVRGISYCEAYSDDSRCEKFTFDNLEFLIDWDIEMEGALARSRAEILNAEGAMLVIDILHSPSRDIKSFFRQILSTFRFVRSDAVKTGKVEIDYSEVAGLQKSVDEGHQPWRLNPVMVALSEVWSYGFTEDDKSTLFTPDVATQHKFGTEITEIDLKISHNSKAYIITLTQPVPGPGKIWIVSEVTRFVE